MAWWDRVPPETFCLSRKGNEHRNPELRRKERKYSTFQAQRMAGSSQGLIGAAISAESTLSPGPEVCCQKKATSPVLLEGRTNGLVPPLRQGSSCILQRWPPSLPSHSLFCNVTLSLLHQENQSNLFPWTSLGDSLVTTECGGNYPAGLLRQGQKFSWKTYSADVPRAPATVLEEAKPHGQAT